MGFFGRLFGGREPPRPPRDVGALARPFAVPAVHLVSLDSPSRSHLGGMPRLPPEAAWPSREGRRLEFLARLSLPGLHDALAIDWLPTAGALLFFYDLKDQPWGFDPKDRGGWAVIHLPEVAGPPSEAATVGGGDLVHTSIGFRRIDSYPPWEQSKFETLEVTEEDLDALEEFSERQFRGLPRHQTGGAASPVQDDRMELECQLASHGIYCGDSSGFENPRTEALARTAGDWKLLLQLDSDEALGTVWGDYGMLYFWVREQDARAGDFTNVWLVLQCG